MPEGATVCTHSGQQLILSPGYVFPVVLQAVGLSFFQPSCSLLSGAPEQTLRAGAIRSPRHRLARRYPRRDHTHVARPAGARLFSQDIFGGPGKSTTSGPPTGGNGGTCNPVPRKAKKYPATPLWSPASFRLSSLLVRSAAGAASSLRPEKSISHMTVVC